ncbi:rhamnogalacturonan acetylesterase [Rhodopirellula maiorica SM1]|uniref:Rhamnogalacturonan acetylesterase n=1 Tax=Rhodopirellula maiorica SM1 TaxID=1265738 RepID=M5RPN8_9BACT|nr:rhamnogalacturonan acetylesterase [Rhodopirellula maiorica]EMI21186.1 rhamnogalacturonan acetylesterase [Rhodopirellula maiorica SM1]
MMQFSKRLHRYIVTSSVIIQACVFAVAGIAAELRPLPRPANDTLGSLVIIGDSTVRNGDGQGGNGQWGWGEPLAELFDSSKLNVVNRAVGGLSSRTYATAGYWDATKALLKPGDFVIMQFGHNDASPINDEHRARGTIPGVGDEFEEIVNRISGEKETVHTYGWYLRKYIREARERGAHPVACSPVPRKLWNGEKLKRASDNYARWAQEVAESEEVPFIDLNEMIAVRYEALGKEKVESLFADEHTHTSLSGARLNAASVVAGLLTLRLDGLVSQLNKRGREIESADAAHVISPDSRPILADHKTAEVAKTRSEIPTLYLIGDSTVRNGHQDGVGWGEVIDRYFDTDKIDVVNRAIGGRSTRSFMREERWQKVLDELEAGDFVVMQFGHNDGGRVGDARFKRRPALPGVGDDTQAVSFEDGTKELVHSYGWYLSKFCRDAKGKGATPIICSPVPHKNNWHEGRFEPDFVLHRQWCQQVADATDSHFIDLTALIGSRYQQLGETHVDSLFADARTHTNMAGAVVNAECVVAGLKELPARPLKPFLSTLKTR